MRVTIIVPVYNEINTIERVLNKIKQASVLGLEKEIILVDDFSTDGTRALLQNLNDPTLKLFYHEKNQGKGAALHTGFEKATGDIIIIQDADLEYDPAEIEKVLKPFVEQNAKVVYGSRYLYPSQSLGFWHSFFNKLFSNIGSLFLRQKVTDIMTCYKAFNREVLASFVNKLESKRFGFEPEVTARIAKAGYKIIEVPISYNPRGKAEGKHMSLKGELESLWALIKYSI